MNWSKIPHRETVIDNKHESIYRCYTILEHVKEMLKRGDSTETIMQFINFCEENED